MTDQPAYIKFIEKSPLVFKIKKVAPEIFAIWKKHMQKQHPAYQCNADPNTLVQDIKDSFNSALESLFKDSRKDKRNTPGWAIGFILGFVPSNLATHWLYEYIYNQTEEYKELMALKATILYLDFDQTTISKIEKIHKYLIDNKAYIHKDCESVDKNVISINKFMKNKEKQHANKNFSNLLIKYLEKIMLEKHEHIFNKISENNYFPKIDQFFSDNEISDLIKNFQEI
ncbi:MAG: hypothetical protein K0R76_472 [Alphaproteobacteria bacterium]|jgi:hypothetical protein|nr:hypothetical protein [Alphaproteobacteria bacterium]MDF3033518.1 hypothetical protein [Alphaproteobacteria bacterium]